MIQLYAFVRGLDGLVAEPLRSIELGPVTAVVGPAGSGTDEDVLRHGLVVQELLESAEAVLPARFGETFADVAALEAAVAPRLSELAERLSRVAGCVELAVRVARRAAESRDRTADGGGYMRARLRSVTADDAAAATLHSLLRRRARDAVVSDPTFSKLLHDACYLVEREAVDEFAQSVGEYATAHPDLDLVCTGPWAPASFAGAA